MARKPAPTSIRFRLASASERLTKAGAPELAEAVDQVLAPGGWELLRTTDPTAKSGTAVNMAIPLLESVRDAVVAAVNDDPDAPSVTAKVNEGLAKFLDGSFALPDRVTTRSWTGQKRASLNVRPATALRDQVSERGVAASRVAAEYLMASYKVGPYREDSQEILPRGMDRTPSVPRVVREAIRERAETTGVRPDDVVNEGFQKFLDGTFRPLAPVWTEEARADMVVLKLRPNYDLYQRVTPVAKEQGLRTLQVALDYLIDQYGITDGVAEPAD